MSSVQTILVCDDHPLFRAGVVSCFAGRPDLEVIAEAVDGASCMAKLELFRPDILIADLSMPGADGFQVLEWMSGEKFSTRSYVLSMHSDLVYVQRARSLGAAGFLAKEDAQCELLSAIDQQPGAFYTSSSIGSPNPSLDITPSDGPVREAMRLISEAEMRVLVMLTENLTSREIGNRLNLSVRTVQAHRISLADKFGVRGSNKLLELAIRNASLIRRRARGM